MKPSENNGDLLKVTDLRMHFPLKKGFGNGSAALVRAVDGISLHLKQGETLGLVGESGCGKSTAARAILRLIEPTSGQVVFQGKDLRTLPARELQALRKDMQIIFQDPYASLNPRKRIGKLLEEPFEIHGFTDRKERADRVAALLTKVGLEPGHARRFPHEFSGGQRQRVGIARAIALHPSLVVADEPVSALDVSIRAQVMNLLQKLKQSMSISYLFISHDMALVEHFCDRVAVMYLGKIIETADSATLYRSPRHPYTEALLSAVPSMEPGHKKQRLRVSGDLPDPASPPKGCAFHSRCPIKEPRCEQSAPALKEVAPGHAVACFLRES